jgi:hypothetical protein
MELRQCLASNGVGRTVQKHLDLGVVSFSGIVALSVPAKNGRIVLHWPSFAAVPNVRFWHKADMAIALSDVSFWG